MKIILLERRYPDREPKHSRHSGHNLHEFSKQTLGDILTVVLNQFSEEGGVSHMEVINFGNRGVMMVHEPMRVTLVQSNFLGG